MVDETTDIRSQSQISVVSCRVVSNESETLDFFLVFSDVRADSTAQTLADRVINHRIQHEFGRKIVAQGNDCIQVELDELIFTSIPIVTCCGCV